MVSETPLSAIHLENMLKLAQLGIVILPPVTEFYTKPKSIDDIVNHGVGKCLDQFDLEHNLYPSMGYFLRYPLPKFSLEKIIKTDKNSVFEIFQIMKTFKLYFLNIFHQFEFVLFEIMLQ